MPEVVEYLSEEGRLSPEMIEQIRAYYRQYGAINNPLR